MVTKASLRKHAEERRRLLVRERDEVERRLARWYERIESDDALEDAAADGSSSSESSSGPRRSSSRRRPPRSSQ